MEGVGRVGVGEALGEVMVKVGEEERVVMVGVVGVRARGKERGRGPWGRRWRAGGERAGRVWKGRWWGRWSGGRGGGWGRGRWWRWWGRRGGRRW